MPINPQALAQTLPKNSYSMGGGLGGYVAGMQTADYLDNMDRGRRSDDLEFASQTNKHNNEMLDNPMKQAERELKTSQASAENDQYKSGDMQNLMRERIRGALDDLKTKQGDNAVRQIDQQAEFMWNLDNDIKSGNLTPADIDGWRKRKEIGEKLGIKNMPDMLTPEYSQRVSKYSGMSALTRKVAGEVLVQDRKQEWMAGEHKLDRDSRERIARMGADSRGMTGSPDNRTIREIQGKEQITTDDISRYAGARVGNLLRSGIVAEIKDKQGKWATEWTQAGSKRKDNPEMSKFASATDYATYKYRERISQYLAEQISFDLSGKPIVVNGQVVGQVGDDSLPTVTKIIMNSLGSKLDGGTDAKAMGQSGQGVATPTKTVQQGYQYPEELKQFVANPKLARFIKEKKIKTQEELRTAMEAESKESPTAKALYDQFWGKPNAEVGMPSIPPMAVPTR